MPQKPFRYLSVCSGIEGATVAWHHLGWMPAAFAEIDKFPSAVLKHHYSQIPNFGNFTKVKGDEYGAINLLVGGTPCQDFSVAGLRAGMDGDRGQLTIEFARLAERLRPRWLVWENVPGVLSSDGGRAFGTFLGILGKLGYGIAYRVLDAQYFGVPQRRRRVFVVGYLGDWRRAAAVLFERACFEGNNQAGKKSKGRIANTIKAGYFKCWNDLANVANLCDAGKFGRRLTPLECERLQGFPDNYTKINPQTADGPRYKALGNSFAVPVVRWIGERIQEVENLHETL